MGELRALRRSGSRRSRSHRSRNLLADVIGLGSSAFGVVPVLLQELDLVADLYGLGEAGTDEAAEREE